MSYKGALYRVCQVQNAKTCEYTTATLPHYYVQEKKMGMNSIS